MLLPAVTQFSLPGAPSRYAECSRAMGFASDADDDTIAGSKLLGGLRSLCTELSVPTPEAYGIAREQVTSTGPSPTTRTSPLCPHHQLLSSPSAHQSLRSSPTVSSSSAYSTRWLARR